MSAEAAEPRKNASPHRIGGSERSATCRTGSRTEQERCRASRCGRGRYSRRLIGLRYVFECRLEHGISRYRHPLAIRVRPLHAGSRRFVAVTMQTSRRWRRAVSAPCTPSLSLGVAAAGAAGPLGGENRCPNGSRKVARTGFGSRRLNPVGTSRLPKSGRWDSNRRRPAWEGGRKTRVECTTRQFSSADAMLTIRAANPLPQNSTSSGSRNGCRP